MSDSGEEAAPAPVSSGQSVTTVTSELVAALAAVESVKPAAAAGSPAGATDDDAAPRDDNRALAGVGGETTPALLVGYKSQTSRKRCRPAEVSPATYRPRVM